MSAFVAVLRRDIGERRLLLGGALLLGCVPLVLPLLPSPVAAPAPEVRTAAALALAGLVAAALGVGLGVSFLVGDLTSGRVRFYFSLPLPGTALFFGKLAAAAFTALACAGLVLLPAAVLGDLRLPATRLGTLAIVALLVAVPVAGLLLFHALGLAIRARSAWALADLAALAGIAVGVALLVHSLGRWPGVPILLGSWPGLAAAVLAALVAGSALPFLRARTDVGRAHRLQVFILWPLLALVVGGFALYARWWLRPSPHDLTASTLSASNASGSWVLVEGAVHGRGDDTVAEYAFDAARGSFELLQVVAWRGGAGARFSADGRHLVWLEHEFFVEGGGRRTISTLDLEMRRRRDLRAGLPLDWPVDDFDVSPDGQLLAGLQSFRGARRLTLLRLADGQVLATVPLELGARTGRVHFLDGHSLRIVDCDLDLSYDERGRTTLGGGSCATRLFDASSGRPISEVEWTAPAHASWEPSPDASLVLVRSAGERRVYDAEKGRLLATLPQAQRSTSCWLPDSGLLVLDRTEGLTQATQVARTGEISRHELPARLFATGAIDDRHVAVHRPGGESYILDLGDLSLRTLGRGLRPISWPRSNPAGGAAARLFVREDGSLLDVDPTTGATRELARLRK